MVDRLQAELESERQTVKALRAASIAQQADRTELETFFLQCIDDVRCVFVFAYDFLCVCVCVCAYACMLACVMCV